MKKRKLVGLTPCFMYPDLSRATTGPKTLTYMGQNLSDILVKEELIPFLIPRTLNEEFLRDVLANLGGVIFQGGTDIEPRNYGEAPLFEKWKGDGFRDEIEFKILELALELQIPILGICRGFQLINIFFGGALYQDISYLKNSSTLHYHPDLYDQHFHEIEFSENSVLNEIYKDKANLRVNSVHHQGIRRLGKGLRVEAICKDDGLIEAISHEDFPHLLGVQWHPEFFVQGTLLGDPLFAWFKKKLISHG